MSDFIDRLKTDRFFQIIILGFFISMIILFFLLKPIFFPKKSQVICYNELLKISTPFPSEKLYPYLSDFTKFCVAFQVTTQSIDEIKSDLLIKVLKEDAPDIVLIDNDFYNKYKDLFATVTPVFVDSLVAFYNKDILDFLNLDIPKTLQDLKYFIDYIKKYNTSYYPVALGTTQIKNKLEIILSLLTLNDNYNQKVLINDNLAKALEVYTSFSDPESEYYSYPSTEGSDLINFANEQTALYIGFYMDKEKILELNPKINLKVGRYPLDFFPPKTKVYSKIYYLAQLNKSKSKSAPHFMNWFYNFQLEKFSQDFDVVPFGDYIDLSEEKKIVRDTVKNFGEEFDFVNKDVLYNNIDKLIDNYKYKDIFYRILGEIYYSL